MLITYSEYTALGYALSEAVFERFEAMAGAADEFKTYAEQQLPPLVARLGELDRELKGLHDAYAEQLRAMTETL